jgi:hypothetical protein
METTESELKEIRDMLIKHIASQESRDEKIDQLYNKMIVGNGKPSLIDTVRGHHEWIEGEKRRRDKWNWVVVGAFISNVFALAFVYFESVIH